MVMEAQKGDEHGTVHSPFGFCNANQSDQRLNPQARTAFDRHQMQIKRKSL